MTYYPPRYLFRRFEILKSVCPGDHFLEVGAGNLMLSADVLQFFEKGTIIDYNPQVLRAYEALRSGLKERIDIIISDFKQSALNCTFDCILACEVLEHLENDNDFISRTYDLLNQHGQLIISVPSRMKYWSIHDETVGHLRRYEKEEIISLLTANKFTEIEIISYGFPFVNILRMIRILFARRRYKEKKEWSQVKQSRESGFVQKNFINDIAGLIVNKYTTYPLSLFSQSFNSLDLSDGYIATARKK